MGSAVAGLWWAAPPTAGGPRDAAPSMAELLSPVGRAIFGEALGEVSPWSFAEENGGFLESSIAADIVRAAWADCAHRLDSAMGAPEPGAAREGEGPPRPSDLGYWSGALRLVVPWWGRDLVLLVSGDRVSRLLGRPAAAQTKRPAATTGALTPVLSALDGRRARVFAQLSTFQLDLGALGSLRIGDVLYTTHALDRPLSVSAVEVDGRGESPLCEAFLGKVGKVRAVELMASEAAAPLTAKPPHGPVKAGSAAGAGAPRQNGKLAAEAPIA